MTKTKILMICFALLLQSSVVFAQRILNDLEHNADQSMIPNAPNYGEDSLESTKEKIVPVDVRAWTIDRKYGERRAVEVDTTINLLQNTSLTEGLRGHYNNLSNLGSPRINRIYMERKDYEDFIFRTPFDFFLKSPDEIKYYNTKSPYANLFYDKGGDKTTGFDHFKAIFTTNAGKHFNFGALYDYMYGQGYYNNQSTAFQNATAWASYINDKYDLHFSFNHNYMKMAENGGITDDAYITNPDTKFDRTYRVQDIPVWLDQNWMRQESDIIHLNHRYSLGFYRTEGTDSASMHDVFVPVTSFFHTMDLSRDSHKFIEYELPNGYHTQTFFPGDSTSVARSTYIKNLLGVSLREGFNKWAKAGINAYAGIENKKYTLMEDPGSRSNKDYKENNVLVGAQIIKTQGRIVHYDVTGEFTLAGENSGDFSVVGNGDLNIPLTLPAIGLNNDTVQIALNAFLKSTKPNFFFRHYHSKHAWWDNENLDKTIRMRLGGDISLPRTKTRLSVGLETLKNYAYFYNGGKKNPYSKQDEIPEWSNEVKVGQESKLIQIISATLRQDFAYGILHLDNDITFQTTTDKDVLPLPTLSTYHNLYINFSVVKNVLRAQLGADMKYFTEYYAPDYSPVISQFMVQNMENRKKIGNYPLISAYLAIDLKQLRAYVQYYHVNQGSGRYFWAPGYPMNPGGIHFGLSWNFYD